MRAFRLSIVVALFLLLAAPALAQQGTIEGEVTRPNGKGLGGVTVVVSELGAVEITDNEGRYRFVDVPAGSYTINLSLGDNADSAEVDVAVGGTARVDTQVDWDVSFAETITVFSASRRRERITEAPAAVTVITQEQLEREATHGQLPKVLEFTPGAEVTQNGLYDFNFNTRGFNSSLNRRVLVLIDGRDPSVVFLSSQEWTSLAVPLDAMANVELVRGPGSALYGADAYNGVINMTTKAPRDSVGGSFKLSGGELSTLRGDLTLAGELGGGWFGRFAIGALNSEEFARSRLDLNGNGMLEVPEEAEYEGLNIEVQPLVQDENDAIWGSLRVDKYFEGGPTLSLEAGYADFEAGGVSVTGIGRVQTTQSERPYFRANLNTQHWNFIAYYNDREAPDSRSLGTGAPLYLFSDKTYFEVQGNGGFADGKGRVVGGASYSEENFDSTDPQGAQTLVFNEIDADFTGVFGQLEYDFSDKLRGVFSARYDESSLYDSQFSPRVALVFSANAKNTFRFNYGEAFQSPNYSELFLQVPVSLPTTALAPFEGFCAGAEVRCGFDSVPIKALGNSEVEVEEIETIEVGYTGLWGRKVFVTVDYYNSQLTNFISDLIPAFDPVLGLINPTFGPYQAPAGLPDDVAAALLASLSAFAPPTLTNDPVTGLALINAVSYTNFGEVDTQGVEIGLNANLNDNWRLDFTYNWFDFDIKEELQASTLEANAPENQFGLALSYVADKFDASIKYRHVDGFFWAAGVFQGDIPSYDLVDIGGTYHINDRFDIGFNVSNAFDEEHYQLFGGDIIGRRALAHIGFRW